MIRDLRAQLEAGAAELGLDLGQRSVDVLGAFLALLDKWNRVYNLTAIREQEKWVTHHLLDSLAVVAHLPEGRLLDVGSGGGFPGIPIAIAQPERKVTLLDSNQKKGAFLRQAAAELGLANAQVATERAEHHRPVPAYDVVVSRAFSDLADFVSLAGPAAAPDGVLVAMKGVHPHEEIARLPSGWTLGKVQELRIPGLDATRHLVFLHPRAISAGNAR